MRFVYLTFGLPHMKEVKGCDLYLEICAMRCVRRFLKLVQLLRIAFSEDNTECDPSLPILSADDDVTEHIDL